MKKRYSIILACVFAFGVSSLSAVNARTITISGKVTDSVSGEAVPGAAVLMYYINNFNIDPNNLSSLKLDTVFTREDGTYSYPMEFTPDPYINLVAYSTLKQGYRVDYGLNQVAGIPLLPATGMTINIKLVKNAELAKDTILVTGKVVDFTTSTGIPNALVVLSGLAVFDTTLNTVLTNADGTFSKQLIISTSSNTNAFVYMVSALHYQPAASQKITTQKQIDLGAIALKKTNVPVVRRSSVAKKSFVNNGMAVYSLNGKMLYNGSLTRVDKALRHYNQAVFVRYKDKNNLTRSEQHMLGR